MNYNVLIEMFNRLDRNPDDLLRGLSLYHSSVGYAVQAIKANLGIQLSYKEVANLMVEEGLLNKHNKPVKMSELVTELDRG